MGIDDDSPPLMRPPESVTAKHAARFCAPPLERVLRDGHVHVWRTALDLPAEQVQTLAHLLSPEETARAEQFYFAADRRQYIVTHAVLRLLLSDYLHCAPQEITFHYQDRGKPTLVGEAATSPIQFNFSHAHELAVYAFSLNTAVGVDIELLQTKVDHARLANQILAAAEKKCYQALPSIERHAAFLTFWTRKEAFVKATGEGLDRRFHEIDTAPLWGKLSYCFPAQSSSQVAKAWSMFVLNIGADYTGALVVAGADPQLFFWDKIVDA